MEAITDGSVLRPVFACRLISPPCNLLHKRHTGPPLSGAHICLLAFGLISKHMTLKAGMSVRRCFEGSSFHYTPLPIHSNFLSFHSAQHHSIKQFALKFYFIINATHAKKNKKIATIIICLSLATSLNIPALMMIMMRLMKRGHIQSSETNPCLVFGLSGHVSSIRNSRITFALHLYHVVSGHV